METEIEKYSPCPEAVEFRRQHKSFKDAWENCPRGDWMLWLAQRAGIDEKLLFKAQALCAKTVIHLMEDDRSKKAVQAALDYSDGKITRKELKIASAYASDAAYAAAAANYAAYASDTAYAYASAAAANYAAYASDTAYAYASAAYACLAAKGKNQKQTADICREVLTEAILEKL